MTYLFPDMSDACGHQRDHSREIIVVGFAGGGGSCEGIKQALGRSPDEALNHDPEAVAMHMANHPETRHWCQNIWLALPSDVAAGRPIGLAWFSPDCKHFSKAKGGKPRSRNIRDLAWVVVGYAKLPRHIRPRVLTVENVEEFQTWGPLLGDGQPCPDRKGETFKKWVGELQRLGYRVEWREIRAMAYGTPTIRKRLYLVARCDGQPIVWPEPTHGPGLLSFTTAADIIDWSLNCPSIFERVRPLAEATMRRIAVGTMRYVVNAAAPFIVNGFRGQDIREPMRTVTAAHDAHGIVVPHLMTMRNAQKPFSAGNEPVHTVTAGGAHLYAVSAFLAKHNGGVVGHGVEQPMGTVTTVDHHSVVTAHLTQFRPNSKGHPVDEPLRTIIAGQSDHHLSTGCQFGVVAAHLTHFYSSAEDGGQGDLRYPIKTVTGGGQHAGLVSAFLTKYFGATEHGQDCRDPLHTVTTKPRFGLTCLGFFIQPKVES
jgi:DNA (cytosine-5)-methyltransferase 1